MMLIKVRNRTEMTGNNSLRDDLLDVRMKIYVLARVMGTARTETRVT